MGAILGIVILHPLTTVIFWFEFNPLLNLPEENFWDFMIHRVRSAAMFELVPMNLAFASVGAMSGLIFAHYYRKLETEHHRAEWLESELNRHLPSLVEGGENERLELKSSLRWDHREKRLNKALEKVIAKTLAGLMNHLGGSLLIGIADDGEVLGIEPDYLTLKHKTPDGFERALTDAVSRFLGANACTLIHCRFPVIDAKSVCWVVVEQSTNPVFLQDGDTARYMLRTGNSTRELDARESHAHFIQRKVGANLR